MDLRELVITLGVGIHELIKPEMMKPPSCSVAGEAASGDYTFTLDEIVETRLQELVAGVGKRAKRRLSFYSEDRGLVACADDPQHVLIIDPIDGTRPAMCRFESSCISIAIAPLNSPVVTLDDVDAAVLIELKSGNILSAARGGSVFYGSSPPASKHDQINGSRLSQKTELRHLFWGYETCARPVEAVTGILASLIDETSFGGGIFVFNSSSYAASRVVLGQLDAYVDPYAALLRSNEGEHWKALSREKFCGKVMSLFPYDIAAAAFIAKQAGAVVCDALGAPIGDTNLLDSSENATLSCLVAGNRELGKTLISRLRKGFQRVKIP